MSLNFRRKAIEVLRKYKSIDLKLRENSCYELISYILFNVLRFVLRLKPVPYRKLVENHYRKKIDVISVDEKLVFLDCFWGRKVGGDPYAIYRKLKEKDNSLQFVWVKNKGVKVPSDVANDDRVTFVQHNTKAYAESLLRCKYLIHNSNLLPFYIKRSGQVLISTWHGVPLKRLGFDIDQPISYSVNTQRNFNVSDFIPVSTEYEYENIVCAYGGSIAKRSVVYSGSPRVDLTVSSDYQEIRERIGIPKKKKLILFAPTWRGSIVSVSSQVNDQVKAIKRMQRDFSDEYELVVSLHHLTKARLKEIDLKVKVAPDNMDVNELLQGVDVLVSDYSSIIVDFMVLDRPIILYAPDLEEYSTERGLYIDLNDLPVDVALTEDELVDSIKLQRKPSDYNSYGYYRQLLFPKSDGLSSDRLVDYIIGNKVVVHGELEERKKLLIYAGGLKDSGITVALKNLVTGLCFDSIDIIVLVDGRYEKTVPSFYKNLRFLKRFCDLIVVNRGLVKGGLESIVFKKYLSSPASLKNNEFEKLRCVFQREARRLFGGFSFDAAIDFSGYSYYWAMLISSVSADKSIIFQHSDMKAELDNPNRTHRHLVNVFYSYRFYSEVVSVSRAIKEVNEARLGNFYGDAKSDYVSNLVDLDRILKLSDTPVSVLSPEFSGVPEEVFKFISVSRLSPEKNLKFLITSFSKVIESGLNCVLFIVGDGSQKAELFSHAAAMGVDDRIVFTGHLNNPYPLIRHSDCLVFPSIYEGQGLVLLEAMMLGTYCIGGDIPAVREALRDTACEVVKLNVDEFSRSMSAVVEEGAPDVDFDGGNYCRASKERFLSIAFG